MSTEVVSVSNRIPAEPYYRFDTFLASLKRQGVTPTILGMNAPWHGLMTKPNHFRTWLRNEENQTERIIICDAWDIVFADHPDQIDQLCQQIFGDSIVFNGEKACWPRADLADKFTGRGPWRYLNSGFMCGPAKQILALLESMELEGIGVDRTQGNKKIEPNDQGEFQYAYTCRPVLMIVDARCEISQTFSGCTLDEFDLTEERIRNKVTDTTPGVLHFNGGSKNEIMTPMLQKLGL